MATSVEVISHWHQSVDGLSMSTMEFYASVESTLREKQVPELRIERAVINEQGVLSAKREYLRIGYGRYRFEICAAPFGKDFFFSWWLVKRTAGFSLMWALGFLFGAPLVALVLMSQLGALNGLLAFIIALVLGVFGLRQTLADGWFAVEDTILATPVLGVLYQRFVRPVTYYSEDTRLMFEATIHRAVILLVSGVLALNNLPPLSPDELKPHVRKVSK